MSQTLPIGAGKTFVDVIDLSRLSRARRKGVQYVIGITERGEIGVPKLCSSWTDYRREFGGFLSLSESKFPLICYWLLQVNKVPLIVVPIGHYTDPTDESTLAGTKATATVYGPSWTYEVTTPGTEADTISIKADGVEIATAAVPATPDNDNVASAIQTAVNALDDYTASVSTATVTITRDDGTGFVLTVTASGATAGTATALKSSAWTAKSIGTWANSKLSVEVKAAQSGEAGKYDIYQTLTGFSESRKVYRGVSENPSATEKAAINNVLDLMEIGTVTSGLGLMKATFSGGVHDTSAIVAADYIGDAAEQTGIYAFGKLKGGTHVSAPDFRDATVDAALIAFAESNKKVRAITAPPVGAQAATQLAYRNGTSPYSHAAYNSWWGKMVSGDIEIFHPDSGEKVQISAIALACVAHCNVANNYHESTPAAGKYSQASGINKVVYDLSAPGLETSYDNVDEAGIIPVVNDDTYGPVFNGNFNLYKSETLLRWDNVAELVVQLMRDLNPLQARQKWAPNSFDMFRQFYDDIVNLMGDNELNPRYPGIREYKYFGDQNAEQVDDLVVNTGASLDNGEFISYLFIKPLVGNKYVGVKLALTNTSVNLEDVFESLTGQLPQ